MYYLSHHCYQIFSKANERLIFVNVWRDTVSNGRKAWQQGLHVVGSQWLTSQWREARQQARLSVSSPVPHWSISSARPYLLKVLLSPSAGLPAGWSVQAHVPVGDISHSHCNIITFRTSICWEPFSKAHMKMNKNVWIGGIISSWLLKFSTCSLLSFQQL